MSDFFSNLYGGGIRRPDVVMNDGPLPPSSTLGGGYPAGFNGTPDGKIDYANTLLGNVNPYAYGEADRLSTQTAYLNVPHRVQRIVPSLDLPEAQPWDSGGSFFRLSHQVDDGDIAFVIRAMFSPYELVAEKKKYNKQGILYAVDPVVNLATVNYILHGLQRFGYSKKNVSWHTLWQALGIDQYFSKKYKEGLSTIMSAWDDIMTGAAPASVLAAVSNAKTNVPLMGEYSSKHAALMGRFVAISFMRQLRREVADYLVKHVIRPFGIPTGSERQGGQHQGSNSAITWPVDFVTTLTIDGLVINMVNFWRHDDLNSGDDLMLYVEDRPYQEYVLSHHPKNVKKQVFPSLKAWEFPAAFAQMHDEHSTNISPATMAMERLWDLIVQSLLPSTSDLIGGPYKGIRDAVGTNFGMIMTGGKEGPSKRYEMEGYEPVYGGFSGTKPSDTGTPTASEKFKKEMEQLASRINVKRNRDAWSREAAAHGNSNYYLPETDKALIFTQPYDTLSMFDMMTKVFAMVSTGEIYKEKSDSDDESSDAFNMEKLIDGIKIHDKKLLKRLQLVLNLVGEKEGFNKLKRFVTIKESVFQLVPGISSSASTGVKEAVWRYGYWHIARSQTMHFKYDQHLDIPNGYHAAIRGKLLQATFAPVWVEPLEDAGTGSVGVNAGFTGAWDRDDRKGLKQRTSKKQRIVSVETNSGKEAETEKEKESGEDTDPRKASRFHGHGKSGFADVTLDGEEDMFEAAPLEPIVAKGTAEKVTKFNAISSQVTELCQKCNQLGANAMYLPRNKNARDYLQAIQRDGDKVRELLHEANNLNTDGSLKEDMESLETSVKSTFADLRTAVHRLVHEFDTMYREEFKKIENGSAENILKCIEFVLDLGIGEKERQVLQKAWVLPAFMEKLTKGAYVIGCRGIHAAEYRRMVIQLFEQITSSEVLSSNAPEWKTLLDSYTSLQLESNDKRTVALLVIPALVSTALVTTGVQNNREQLITDVSLLMNTQYNKVTKNFIDAMLESANYIASLYATGLDFSDVQDMAGQLYDKRHISVPDMEDASLYTRMNSIASALKGCKQTADIVGVMASCIAAVCLDCVARLCSDGDKMLQRSYAMIKECVVHSEILVPNIVLHSKQHVRVLVIARCAAICADILENESNETRGLALNRINTRFPPPSLEGESVDVLEQAMIHEGSQKDSTPQKKMLAALCEEGADLRTVFSKYVQNLQDRPVVDLEEIDTGMATEMQGQTPAATASSSASGKKEGKFKKVQAKLI